MSKVVCDQCELDLMITSLQLNSFRFLNRTVLWGLFVISFQITKKTRFTSINPFSRYCSSHTFNFKLEPVFEVDIGLASFWSSRGNLVKSLLLYPGNDGTGSSPMHH